MQQLTKAAALKRCPDLLSNQRWLGVRGHKYWFRCQVHGKYQQKFSRHEIRGCAACGHARCGRYRSLTTAEMYKQYPDMLRGQKYTGAHGKKYLFRCRKHGTYQQNLDKHRKGSRCQKCGIDRIKSALLTPAAEAIRRRPDMLKRQTWKGVNHKYWFMCRKHGAYRRNFGHMCPKCRASIGEREIEQVLVQRKIPFVREHRISECRNSIPLPFDFAVQIVGRLCLVEFNGRQHYEATEYFGGSRAFKQRRHYDNIKADYCKKNRIPLLVIPYTQIDNSEKLLLEFFERSLRK